MRALVRVEMPHFFLLQSISIVKSSSSRRRRCNFWFPPHSLVSPHSKAFRWLLLSFMSATWRPLSLTQIHVISISTLDRYLAWHAVVAVPFSPRPVGHQRQSGSGFDVFNGRQHCFKQMEIAVWIQRAFVSHPLSCKYSKRQMRVEWCEQCQWLKCRCLRAN